MGNRLGIHHRRRRGGSTVGSTPDKIEDAVSSTSFANRTDVVNISFALEDYPYQQDDPPARPRQILQGRVITIDTIGIASRATVTTSCRVSMMVETN